MGFILSRHINISNTSIILYIISWDISDYIYSCSATKNLVFIFPYACLPVISGASTAMWYKAWPAIFGDSRTQNIFGTFGNLWKI